MRGFLQGRTHQRTGKEVNANCKQKDQIVLDTKTIVLPISVRLARSPSVGPVSLTLNLSYLSKRKYMP